MHIDCPVLGCGGVLEPEYCRSILPPEVFDRWGNALCEALILEAERFYCPFKDCSALLINDGGAVVRESECPNCRRLFCAQCKVPWHAGVECQELNEGEREREDIMLMKLAEKKHWRRCPKCRFFVQKKSGCAFVKCRCGVEFCYRCGAEAKLSHYSWQYSIYILMRGASGSMEQLSSSSSTGSSSDRCPWLFVDFLRWLFVS
ncbi:E3 ubiquitin-protein ligase RNF144B-like [Eucalyptus grandis]|uniref:E3 ubiquitin-protein ligase RNF144B-like n=1 Tax=Eucalyptus grandis TaxID=71139 RepID=UPI00192E9C5B|nr:E3 ubiquitin-protein ligase RNF144B-like [Eucalyptus grandis]